jgi:hypothetical protein
MAFKFPVCVLLKVSTRLKGRVEEKRRRRRTKYQTRLCFCRNSRRLWDASIVKTISNKTKRIDVMIVSMPL